MFLCKKTTFSDMPLFLSKDAYLFTEGRFTNSFVMIIVFWTLPSTWRMLLKTFYKNQTSFFRNNNKKNRSNENKKICFCCHAKKKLSRNKPELIKIGNHNRICYIIVNWVMLPFFLIMKSIYFCKTVIFTKW